MQEGLWQLQKIPWRWALVLAKVLSGHTITSVCLCVPRKELLLQDRPWNVAVGKELEEEPGESPAGVGPFASHIALRCSDFESR